MRQPWLRRDVVTTLLGVASTFPPQAGPPQLNWLLASPAEAAAAAPGMLSPGKLAVYALKGAALDPRSFRGLILANGMRVLLVQDPTATTGAASMNVQVGSLSDPTELPGLAHFCEHMLFLGTKQYPDEGSFERVVSSAGGSNNAYTASEETNYFFDVQGGTLPKALDYFAGFFTAPLFTESATAREVNAIDSEHSKNLQSDFWRYEQLFKLRADPAHPFGKFGTGTRQTLRGGDATARSALLAFHERYYLADQMALAIVGPQKLDALQKLAVDKFEGVPASPAPPAPLYAPSISSAAYDDLPLPFRPAEAPPKATLMVPVNDVRTLKLVWCVPVVDVAEWVRTKPDEIWSTVIRNRADGGLLPLLKKRGLATSLEPYADEFTRSFLNLNVDIALTEKGLKRWREVASLLFGYLRLLASQPLPEYVVDEFRALADIGYRYAEPSKPQDYAQSVSASLSFYEPERWLTGPSTVEPGGAAGGSYLLSFCKEPANAMITLLAKDNEAKARETEPIYGTKYSYLPISKEADEWRNAPIPPELGLPMRNTYIPNEAGLAIKYKGATKPKPEDVAPTVLRDEPGARIHFLQDATFQRPKAFAYFLFRSNLLYSSPLASVTAELFQSVLADGLQDKTYQAALAGLGTSLNAEYNGLFLTAQGYNARLPELVDFVSSTVKTAELPSDAFERQREILKQTLRNFDRKQPVSLCSYYRNLALETPRYTTQQLLKAAEDVKRTDLDSFQSSLLGDAVLECFVTGNVDEEQAARMVSSVSKALPMKAPLTPDQIPRRQVRKLERGRLLQQFVAANAAEKNSATEVLLQVGMDEGDDWLLLAVLTQLIGQPFYSELRTEQQLGYIVQSSITSSEGVRGLAFSVQSNVQPPPEVERRIDTFLRGYRETLAKLPDEELAMVTSAFASQSTDVDKRIASQASRFWSEIVQRRYDYGRPWRTAQRVKKVTRQQLLEFYDQHLMPGAPDERRLATHVFAKADVPAALIKDTPAGDYYPRAPEKLPKGLQV